MGGQPLTSEEIAAMTGQAPRLRQHMPLQKRRRLHQRRQPVRRTAPRRAPRRSCPPRRRQRAAAEIEQSCTGTSALSFLYIVGKQILSKYFASRRGFRAKVLAITLRVDTFSTV